MSLPYISIYGNTIRKMRYNDAFYVSRNVKDDASLKRCLLACHCIFKPTMTLLESAIFDEYL